MRLTYPAYCRRAALKYLLAAGLLGVFVLAIYLIFVDGVFNSLASDARSSAYVALAFILVESCYLLLRGVGAVCDREEVQPNWAAVCVRTSPATDVSRSLAK